ncbi:hypothetical protein ACIRBX_12070 [Kitasatospora sp. NPDC096147]|uniref:hypothetical protein n=1 Tax=Kitasatospora sp. NPDC096147 TaxID=3364093 RepID=UPI003802C0D7
MPEYYVPVDEIRVHFVKVHASDETQAVGLAVKAVRSDPRRWYLYTDEPATGDAETPEQWAASGPSRLFAEPPRPRPRGWGWLLWWR